MPSNRPRVEHERKTGRRRDKFAARLASIVFRWRAVYLQQPHPAETTLWMSARGAAKSTTRNPI
jgi:hypothetical protein